MKARSRQRSGLLLTGGLAAPAVSHCGTTTTISDNHNKRHPRAGTPARCDEEGTMKKSLLALASGAFILGAAEFVMMGTCNTSVNNCIYIKFTY